MKKIMKRALGVGAAGVLLAVPAMPVVAAPPAIDGICHVYSGGGWLGAPCPSESDVPVTRYAGDTKWDTTALISEANFEPGVAVVYIANGNTGMVDALGAGPVSAKNESPILAVPRNGNLPQPVADELDRLNPAEVIILGGKLAVSDDMAAQVTEAANK